MISRQQIVLSSVAGVALLAVVYFIYSSISGSLATKRTLLASVRKKVEDKKSAVNKGAAANRKLVDYRSRALPPDEHVARRVYQKYLLELIEKNGLKANVSLGGGSTRGGGGVYTSIAYNIKGTGSLEQATRFLYDFYAIDHLHRISALTLKPKESTKDLDITMTVEALSMPAMPGAPKRTEMAGKPSKRLPAGKVEDYVKAITVRNLFGPPHQPPAIASTTAQAEYPIGSPVSFDVKASDPENRPITYALENAKLEGAKIDPKSGSFSWTPKAKGSYEVVVRATDGGTPAKSVTKTVKFAVVDPPPPPVAVAFDEAKFTHLSAVIDVEGQGEAWFFVRTKGEKLVMREGDEIKVGNLTGKIVQIGDQDVEILLSDGKRWLVTIGDTLRDGRILPPTTATTPAPTPEAPAPAAVGEPEAAE